MNNPEQGTTHAQDERIVALAADYLGVEWERLRGRGRDQYTVEARHLLCYLLDRAVYTRAAIGRLLVRDHSTIIHAIGRVERSEALADEGRRLVRAVLPFVGEGGGPPAPGAVPVRAVSRSLLQALLGTLPLADVRAVRAYVCGALLGRERVPAPQAAWGLCVLAARPGVRAAVEEVLESCGLRPYGGLITLQLGRAGLPARALRGADPSTTYIEDTGIARHRRGPVGVPPPAPTGAARPHGRGRKEGG